MKTAIKILYPATYVLWLIYLCLRLAEAVAHNRIYDTFIHIIFIVLTLFIGVDYLKGKFKS